MKITLNFEMDDKTAKLFLQSSIERVINTSMRMVLDNPDNDSGVNYEDWEEWKPVILTFWIAAHDAVVRNNHSMGQSENVFTLQKGDL